MKETEYDRIMKLGEDEYLRLKKENDPYAFHRAVEMASRVQLVLDRKITSSMCLKRFHMILIHMRMLKNS